jgi:hypothetical protein
VKPPIELLVTEDRAGVALALGPGLLGSLHDHQSRSGGRDGSRRAALPALGRRDRGHGRRAQRLGEHPAFAVVQRGESRIPQCVPSVLLDELLEGVEGDHSEDGVARLGALSLSTRQKPLGSRDRRKDLSTSCSLDDRSRAVFFEGRRAIYRESSHDGVDNAP